MSDKTSLPKTFIAGGFSGFCGILVGQPMDIVKLRLQTQPKPEPGMKPLYSGTIDCAIKTVKRERFFGLYRGMSVPLMTTTPLMAVSFFGFSLGQSLQKKHPDEVLTPSQLLLAGMLSGFLTTTITTPGERIKVLLQMQTEGMGPKLYKGPFDVAKALYRQGGIATLYRGIFPTLLRDVPGLGAFYLTYSMVRRALAPEGKEKEMKPLPIILAGGSAGVVAWLIGIGPDVVKSRLQSAPEGTYPNGMRSVVSELIRKEGPSALFKGTGPVVIRAFPANAALFLGYEAAMDFMNWIAPGL